MDQQEQQVLQVQLVVVQLVELVQQEVQVLQEPQDHKVLQVQGLLAPTAVQVLLALPVLLGH